MHLVISNCSGVGENCAALLCGVEPRGKHGTDLMSGVCVCGAGVTGLCVCADGGLSSSNFRSPCSGAWDPVGWSDKDPVDPRGRRRMRW